MKPRKKSGTDFKRLDAMTDADIDLSDIPEVPPEMFAKGIVRRGLKPITKQQLAPTWKNTKKLRRGRENECVIPKDLRDSEVFYKNNVIARAILFLPEAIQNLMRRLLRPDKSIRDGIGKSKCPPRNDIKTSENQKTRKQNYGTGSERAQRKPMT